MSCLYTLAKVLGFYQDLLKNLLKYECEMVNIKDKKIPVCTIMGANISAINMGWLVDYIKNNIKSLKKEYIIVSNVHTTVTVSEDAEYKKAHNEAILAIPDGGPLSAVGRKRGFKDMRRATGPDLMEEIFEISKENGYRHYFYGSTQETLDRLRKSLMDKYPDLQIAGMYSPPFRKNAVLETDDIIKKINDSNADFVWVGLGAPKQGKWMSIHNSVVSGLKVGVGAGFDYHAGCLQRAPMWMQKTSLEWLYRLIQEPKRLFKRYFTTNTKYIWNAVIRGK